MHNDPGNLQFELALKFVRQTDRNIFLTGRAGTGKTTFLKSIKDKGFKKMAVVAPTGVAAINAGGVTIHSLFQLAPGTFVPGNQHFWNSSATRVFNKDTLLSNLRYSKAKRELFRELELLIIDEVSMVKADTIDAVDTILRWIRFEPDLPFGGVQVLFIGDLFQLPPVMPEDEWELLRSYYESPFFFDAHVLKKNEPVCIELQKIYRQKDSGFIELLNAVRNNITTSEQLEILNRFYQPFFKASGNDTYITLTTHNAKADVINQHALQELNGTVKYFHAQIKGEFPGRFFPVEEAIAIKAGAQIMFTKNDKGEGRKYYNGKIGTVSAIKDNEKIFIRFEGQNEELELERETWLNIRYQYNKEKNIIDEEELGSFTQFPIRLAWAITIHKSQGLTFEKAIIDAGDSFSPGQVYVALSRLKTLNKLVLYSKINPLNISTDERVLRFSQLQMDPHLLDERLMRDQNLYVRKNLVKSFSMYKLFEDASDILKEMEERGLLESGDIYKWTNSIVLSLKEKKEVAIKFMMQLDRLLEPENEFKIEVTQERISSAFHWFSEFLAAIKSEVELKLKSLSTDKIAKKHLPSFKKLLLNISIKQKQMFQSLQIINAMFSGKQRHEILEISEQPIVPDPVSQFNRDIIINTNSSKDKTPSAEISLQFFRAGKSIEQIATTRNLAISTIQGHLMSFIETGEVKITDVVEAKKIDIITEAMHKVEGGTMKPVKDALGPDFSYSEIRAVYLHMRSLSERAVD